MSKKFTADIDALADHLATKLDVSVTDAKNALVGYEPPEKMKLTFNTIVIAKYSDKSYAILGDTKGIKETLKGIGTGVCKYNASLRFGPGWIFQSKYLSVVTDALKEKGIKYKKTDNDEETIALSKGGKEEKSDDDEAEKKPKKGSKKAAKEESDSESENEKPKKGSKKAAKEESDSESEDEKPKLKKKPLPSKKSAKTSKKEESDDDSDV